MKSIAWRLFATFWMLYALHFATNIVREVYLALSIGDGLSFDVSEYVGLHPDLFTISGRGAFINNNPGASMVGAAAYALVRPAIEPVVAWSRRARARDPDARPREYATVYAEDRDFYRRAWARGLDVKLGLAAGAMQALAMASLSALSVVVMFRILASRMSSLRGATALAALYGVATPVFYRTAQLNQNLLVSHCAFFAFALLWQPWTRSTPGRRSCLLAGLLGGWALVCDYSGLIAAGFVGAYAIARCGSHLHEVALDRGVWWVGAGTALSASVLLWYQWVCFGSPLYPAQYYMPSTELSVLGHHGLAWPKPDLLWDTALSLRFGLFTSAPLLVLALFPPAWRSHRVSLIGPREAWCIAIFCVVLFVLCGAVQYGRFQELTGVRYVVPVSPLLFLVAAGVLRQLRLAVALAIGIGGAYWSWCLAMYRDVQQGLGVPESVIRVSTEGVRLPWLTTLERMGYVQAGFAPLLLGAFGLFVLALWRRGVFATAEREMLRVTGVAR